MTNKGLLFFLATVLLGVCFDLPVGHAQTVNVVYNGEQIPVSLPGLPQTTYATVYNHPILNPGQLKLRFEGVLVANILNKVGVKPERVRMLHVFGKDDYLVSLRMDAISNYRTMVVFDVKSAPSMDAAVLAKMQSAVPLLVFQYDMESGEKARLQELNRNYWCWWVKTIVIEENERPLPLLRISSGRQIWSVTPSSLQPFIVKGSANTALQKGVTQPNDSGDGSGQKSVPFIQVPLQDVLRSLPMPEIKRLVAININGNKSALEMPNADLRDIYLGFVPNEGLYQQGFPAVLSLVRDRQFVKNWPYITELIVE